MLAVSPAHSDKRKSEAGRIRAKYPDRIPVICEKAGENVPDIDKKKCVHLPSVHS
jgi:GABA(A) receptor-associated protein